jgi:4-amino-4-deoxy-L-arabinose transferase-like glycosyltransferase
VRRAAPVLALLAFGVVVRLWVAVAAEGKSFSDNAVVALMAMHALSGHFYTFYWGQAWIGSLEALVVAPFFAAFGVRDLTLSAGLLPWTVAFACALYAVTRRCGGERAGLWALLFCALAPADVLYLQVTARGGYPGTLALGTTLLWLTMRIVWDPLTPRARGLHTIACGAIAGIGFWANQLILPYLVVCGGLLLATDPRLPFRPSGWTALLAFFLGSAPFWVFNWRHGFPTFELASVPDRPSPVETLRWALAIGVPDLLGVRDLQGQWTFGWVGRLLATAALAATLASSTALFTRWRVLLRGRVVEAGPVMALWLLLVATVAIYVAVLPSRFQIGRYLLPAASASIPLIALGVSWLAGRRPIVGFLVGAALTLFYGAVAIRVAHDFRAARGRYTAGPIESLAAHLEERGIRFGYADYSEAAITTYFTQERVILSDYHERYFPLNEIAFRDPALVLTEGDAAPTLRALDARFDESRIPGYRIYWPIRYDGVPRAPLNRDGWRVTATVANEEAPLVLDDDPWSYWSVPSGKLAALTLDLRSERTVSGVYLALGERKSDAFQHVRVESSFDGERWTLVKNAAWTFPVSFRPDGQVSVMPDDVQMVLFPARSARWIRLALLEPNVGFNWSIGEIAVLGVGPTDAPVRLETPRFGDPERVEAASQRLQRDVEREPDSSRPLRALEVLYRSNGDAAGARQAATLLADRFTPATLVGWQFGHDLEFVGYDWRAAGPRSFEITYYWRAVCTMGSDYAMTGHFQGAETVHQDDYVLGAPARTTRSWEPGETFKQTRRIELSRDVPAGRYAFEVGVWDPETRRHLQRGWWRGNQGLLLYAVVGPTDVRIERP